MGEPHRTFDQQQDVESHAPYMTVFYALLNLTVQEYFYAKYHGTWGLLWMLLSGIVLTGLVVVGSRWAGLHAGRGWIVLDLLPAVLLTFIHVPLILGLLILAVTKATLVGMFFMHLKFEGRWVFYMLVPAGFLAMIFIFALIPDIAMQEGPAVESTEEPAQSSVVAPGTASLASSTPPSISHGPELWTPRIALG
ncbi:MAG TPA: cytochrome C oxidase subunit IV family protein [Isosphaeraceae bacterium]|jgi:hypothetical protein|nr:cytochrome C oxidase subunit IV family protein [Isosphaeraceae bacterium]